MGHFQIGSHTDQHFLKGGKNAPRGGCVFTVRLKACDTLPLIGHPKLTFHKVPLGHLQEGLSRHARKLTLSSA